MSVTLVVGAVSGAPALLRSEARRVRAPALPLAGGLLDVNLPGMDGVAGVSTLKARHPPARVVMLAIRDEPTMTGEALFISLSAVNKHVQRIYDKLHVSGGNAAVAKALRERLLDEA